VLYVIPTPHPNETPSFPLADNAIGRAEIRQNLLVVSRILTTESLGPVRLDVLSEGPNAKVLQLSSRKLQTE
jgi:hypothetical protein